VPGLDQVSYAERMAQLARHCDVRAATDGWIATTARMLGLGFTATDPANLNRGYCVMSQNLALDGGVVDLNSLRPFATFANPSERWVAAARTVQVLAQSIAWLYVGPDSGAAAFGERIPDTYRITWNAIRRRLIADRERGIALDPYAEQLFCGAPEHGHDGFHQLFQTLFTAEEYRPSDREKAKLRQ
jgi:hypothetical protein